MRKMIVLVMAFLMIMVMVNASTFAAESDKPVFKDVPTSHWAYASIMNAAQKGYVKGFPDGTFRPNDPVTVSQFISMLVLSMTEKDESGIVNWSKATLDRMPEYGKEHVIYGKQYDFSQGKPWYINYVNILKEWSIINNQFNGRYEENLTRERAADIASNLTGIFEVNIIKEYGEIAAAQLKDFSKIDEFSRENVGSAVIRGLMTGFPDGTWKPKNVISRAEAIAIIERFNSKALRTPKVPNLAGVNYSDVPAFGFPDPQRMIFLNAEMKKVYDTLAASTTEFNGETLLTNGQIKYYKDEVEKDKDIRKSYYYEGFTEQEQYYDLVINPTGNTYYMLFNGKEGSFGRVNKPTDQYLSMIFNEKDAAEVMKILNDNINNAKNGFEIKKTIAKRQVTVASLGRNILHLSISAYGDN